MEHMSIKQTFPSPSKTSALTAPLIVGVITIIIAWYLQYVWRRRNWYLSSIQLPGPLALPIVGSAFSFIGDTTYITNKLSHMFNIYPGIFRIWFGNQLIYAVTDPKHIEILLSSPHALQKSFQYNVLKPIGGEGLMTAPASKWKRNRKIINPAFNQRILDKFVDIFVEQSNIFVELIRNKYVGRGEIDISAPMARVTLDSIVESSMGLQLKAQTTDSEVPLWIDRVMELGFERAFNIFYHHDLLFEHSASGKELYSLVDKLKALARKVVIEKRTQHEEKMKNQEQEYVDKDSSKIKPFLDLLIEMRNENNLFSDDELIDETLTLIMAGTDTNATSICLTLTMLGMQQDIQEKVLAEVLEVVGPKRDVHFSDIPKLKYLERVIKETIRIFPLAAFFGRDITENIDIGDCVIPKGTSVMFGILKIHRDEKYWPDPLKFDPDRFLPEEIAKRPPGCYIPFSYGPRNCIGMKYAMMSVKTVVATVLRKYKVQTSYKRVEDIELKVNIVVRPKDGFKISMELRD